MSMGMEANKNGLTYEDFLLLPDDGKRHELIGGALRDTFAKLFPSKFHWEIIPRH